MNNRAEAWKGGFKVVGCTNKIALDNNIDLIQAI